MKPLIGLCGDPGSGKDTVADMLRGRILHRKAFADPLKLEVYETFFANDFPTVEGFKGHYDRHKYDPVGSLYGYLRPLAQWWGTDFRRAQDIDYWVKRTYLGRDMVVTDVRYPNEADAVRKAGGLIWEVVRPGTRRTGHSSDYGMDAVPKDARLHNVSDLAALAAQVNRLLDEAGA